MSNYKTFSLFVENLSTKIMLAAGTNTALLIAFCLVIGWALAGIHFHFSEHWQMIIETASSIVTFLMVFLIQKSQNKDSLSIQLKLNELVAANELASNRLVNVEGMSEDELKIIRKYYSKLSDFARTQDSLQQSHSIDEQHREHAIKHEMEQELTRAKDPDQESA